MVITDESKDKLIKEFKEARKKDDVIRKYAGDLEIEIKDVIKILLLSGFTRQYFALHFGPELTEANKEIKEENIQEAKVKMYSLKELKEKCAQLEKKLMQAESSNGSGEAIKEFEEKLTKKDEELAKCHGLIDKYLKEKERLEEQSDEYRKRYKEHYDDLEKIFKAAGARTPMYNERLSETIEKLEKASQKQKYMENWVDDNLEDLESKKKEIEDLKKQNEELQNALKLANNLIPSSSDEYSKLLKDYEEAKTRNKYYEKYILRSICMECQREEEKDE